jgi:hypothetical protein
MGIPVLATASVDTISGGAGMDKVFKGETVEVVVLRGMLMIGRLPVSVCG